MDEVHAWHKQDLTIHVHHCRNNNDFEADDFSQKLIAGFDSRLSLHEPYNTLRRLF